MLGWVGKRREGIGVWVGGEVVEIGGVAKEVRNDVDVLL